MVGEVVAVVPYRPVGVVGEYSRWRVGRILRVDRNLGVGRRTEVHRYSVDNPAVVVVVVAGIDQMGMRRGHQDNPAAGVASWDPAS